MTGSDEEGEATTTVDGDGSRTETGDASDANDPVCSTTSRLEDELTGADPAVERAAESFVELESELREPRDTDGSLRGRAVDVRRIAANDVPQAYPRKIPSAEALELTVIPADGPDAEGRVYFEWPPGDEGALATLLGLRGIPQSEFASLHGEAVPLRVESGHLVPDVPDTPPRGSKYGAVGIVAGVGANVAAYAALAMGAWALLGSVPVFVGLILVNFVLLPLSTYLDGWYLRTHTDWDHGPMFWATIAVLVGFNVLSSLVYLYTRWRAKPL